MKRLHTGFFIVLLTATGPVCASELVFPFVFHPEEVSIEQRNGFLFLV
jgi:hypothetical protein